ncbi:MAG TPA: KH domain-containing protein [Nitrososphaeraceae archaeon]|jgi:ribosomal RNA assembly protein
MSFQQAVKVPNDRIGVIIGKDGRIKNEIETKCNVLIRIDSESGSVIISPRDPSQIEQAFKAVEIISAISRGFSPERSYRLLGEDVLQVVDLNEYVGRSQNQITRLKGRLIGERGKSRKTIEDLTNTAISIYGHTVAIIGNFEDIKLASDAILHLVRGRSHKMVYNLLQEKRRRDKIDRLYLWEESNLQHNNSTVNSPNSIQSRE